MFHKITLFGAKQIIRLTNDGTRYLILFEPGKLSFHFQQD